MENIQYRKLWIALTAVIVFSLGVLGYYGWELYQIAPPVPQRVVTATGKVVFTGAQIRDGQNTWQSIGGQEVGSVGGHGAYVAPDWSADWLHRELVWITHRWASAEHPGKKYAELNAEQQAALRARLLLPVGLLQAWVNVEHGMWYARSAEFMQTPLMDTLRWLRVIGDTIFAAGAVALGWLVLGLKTGWSIERQGKRRTNYIARRR